MDNTKTLESRPKTVEQRKGRNAKLRPPSTKKKLQHPNNSDMKSTSIDEIQIIPLPDAHHRDKDARLKRLELLQARTGRPVFISEHNHDGGRLRKRRYVNRKRKLLFNSQQ